MFSRWPIYCAILPNCGKLFAETHIPFTLPAISRRRFLGGTLAAGTLLAGRRLFAAAEVTARPAVDPHRIALLSDSHIFKEKDKVARGVNMFDNLVKVVGEVVALSPAPAAVLLNGDCAFHAGTSEDYATFLEAMDPIRQAGLPIHLTLGNHDNRERFLKAVTTDDARQKVVEHRVALMVKADRANWFILDSLNDDSMSWGDVGDEQIAWLAKALDAESNKPAIVMVHHNPDEGKVVSGLSDTKALMDVLLPRKHVKALFYGHTHDWHRDVREGMHLVNLPPVAYVFTPGKPNGWVDAHLAENGMKLELHTLDPKNDAAGEKVELAWR